MMNNRFFSFPDFAPFYPMAVPGPGQVVANPSALPQNPKYYMSNHTVAVASEDTQPMLPKQDGHFEQPVSRATPTRIKHRKNRPTFSPYQRKSLEAAFQKNQYPKKNEKHVIASRVDLTEKQINVWFQNRRTQWKKKHVQTNPLNKPQPGGYRQKPFQSFQPLPVSTDLPKSTDSSNLFLNKSAVLTPYCVKHKSLDPALPRSATQ